MNTPPLQLSLLSYPDLAEIPITGYLSLIYASTNLDPNGHELQAIPQSGIWFKVKEEVKR
jgi:hypothetical protein